MNNPWNHYGMTMTQWRDLPWKKKRKMFYQLGMMSFWQFHFPTFRWWWKAFWLWKNEPPGGYLFQAWCRHNAETSEFKGPPMWWYDPPDLEGKNVSTKVQPESSSE